ncbi:CRISPR-associated endonuclease Cas1 [Candidatus Accumulibacter contiguus]|uniref:CRISPR-associated endonuclease Cas1 n=1 Tax=Candidatus Accumulibacter contiguus TaxID=2954381 RepID=UPI002FC29C64
MLSLGYTLLHAEAVLALYGAGLDPFVGFYHALDFGRESLACDLVEPLRVEVDQHALMLFRSEKLRPRIFHRPRAAACSARRDARASTPSGSRWPGACASCSPRACPTWRARSSQAGAVDAPCSPAIDARCCRHRGGRHDTLAEGDDDDF